MKAVGVAGTAKNTGKTTTMRYLLERLWDRGCRPAITSIGYDGEDLDNITGLPKPKVWCPPGCIVATAETCLRAAGRSLKPLSGTGVATPLGPVCLAQATEETRVVLAGPNKTSGLETVLSCLEAIGVPCALVDGALNRLAPLCVTGGLVLATGPARDPDLTVLAREARAMAGILALPACPEAPAAAVASLLTPEAGVQLARRSKGRGRVHVTGPAAPAALTALAGAIGQGASVEVVLADPLKLLVSGDPLGAEAAVQALLEAGARCLVAREVPLLAVTVCPAYPAYESGTYRAAAIESGALLEALRPQLRVPVCDVVSGDGHPLVERVLAAL